MDGLLCLDSKRKYVLPAFELLITPESWTIANTNYDDGQMLDLNENDNIHNELYEFAK